MARYFDNDGPIDKAIRDIANTVKKGAEPAKQNTVYNEVTTYLQDYTAALLNHLEKKILEKTGS